MTSLIAKFILGRIFQESKENKQGREDPYFDYPAEELGRAGKKRSRRRKKALPPGLTEEEGQILTKVKRRAYRLDLSLGSLFGIRFGWGSVIGFVPVLGDILDALLSLMVVNTARKADLPSGLKFHMLFNIALDFVIGLVPFVGDIIDAGYKCNTRNAVLLEKHLRQVGKKRLRDDGITNVEDPSLPGGYETPPEEIDIEAQAPSRHRSTRNGGSRRDDAPDIIHTRSVRKEQRYTSRRDRPERNDARR